MRSNPSLLIKISGVLFFLIFALGAFFGFYTESSRLIDGIYNHLDIIIFDKSAMYILGGGIFCLNMFMMSSYLAITNKQPLEDNKRNVIIVFIVPMIIMFVFPHIVHGYVKSYVNENSYVYCQDQSVVEYRFTKYIYAKDLNTCKTYKK